MTREMKTRKFEIGHPEEEEDDDDDDDDDDEEDEEDEGAEFATCAADNAEVKQEQIPLWNSFVARPKEEESISMADTTVIDMLIKVMQLLAYVFTFAGVLLGAVSSKTIMLLMTSQLAANKTVTVKKGSLNLILEIPPEERYLWVWALFISYAVPEIGTFVRSIRHILFKGHTRNKIQDDMRMTTVIVTLVMETLHVIGMAFFVIEVLPNLDVVKGVMLTNCVCLMPAVLSAASYDGGGKESRVAITMDIMAILFQITGFFLWPAVYGGDNPRLWFIPPTLLFISCGWWMNFVLNKSKIRLMRILGNVKDRLKENDVLLYKLYVWVSLYKILVFALATCGILAWQGTDLKTFLTSTAKAFDANRTMDAYELFPVKGSSDLFTVGDKAYPVQTAGSRVWWIILPQALSAYLCYAFSKFAYKVMISSISFALPVIFVVPATILLITVLTGYRIENPNAFDWFTFGYVFFNGPFLYDAAKIFLDEWGWVWIFWLISQTWITVHVWSPKCERLSRTEKLFATPMYSDFVVEQSVLLNRRRDKLEEERTITNEPHIIACATMWHESKPEMLEMLKSILRMDEDCCMRQLAKETWGDGYITSYTYESHIFFDNAFDVKDKKKGHVVVNSFVRDFVESVNKAVAAVYGDSSARILPPEKSGTPYGGRLTYTLPCQTKLYVHLKNSDKIRHKKRWSQVMYMYYLLGYNLMEKNPAQYEDKLKKAENIFLLALDGDIDFKPEAVLLLVDLMRKNESVGAACGRIHPVGAGLMVWYQTFEYAIGHWLQKATEHMIGCVLCSPGCFSLFRGSALMSENVMKTYTTPAEEARHYVQYDQGEDRWLCTLLLQRGYRVEYSAASDAYTRCPETFKEFYTQRRRWIPSTMANIVDLLSDYKKVVQINNDISMLYIAYQVMLMVGTVIGPGTIFLLLVSAFNAAFYIDNWTAFYYNMIPIVLYMVICLTLPEKFQITSALIMSGVYGLIMMAVLVGMVMQISEDGYLAPSTIFLYIVAGEIIIAGLIHPQEILCLLKGPIYYVTIPSMYLLLIIYSVCNLNCVSWGTREVKPSPEEVDLEEVKKAEEEEKKKGGLQSILDKFSKKSKTEDEGAVEFSLGNFFKLMMCTRPKADSTKKEMAKINESLQVVGKRLEGIERTLEQGPPSARLPRSVSRSSIDQFEVDGGMEEVQSEDKPGYPPDAAKEEDTDEQRDDLTNPYWIEDDLLKSSRLVVMDTNEANFWKELIKKYLSPLKEDEEKQKKISNDLRELRDKMVVTFFMLNALFVTVVFLLQLNKSKVHFNWPLDATVRMNITASKEIFISKTYLQLEPVGVLFIVFFAAILVVQFLAMFFHRFETLCHLISTTDIRKQKRRMETKMKDVKKKLLAQKRPSYQGATPVIEVQAPVDMTEHMGSIFSEMKHKEDLEKSEKQEKRKSSLINRLAHTTMDAVQPVARHRYSNFRSMKRLKEVPEEVPEEEV